MSVTSTFSNGRATARRALPVVVSLLALTLLTACTPRAGGRGSAGVAPLLNADALAPATAPGEWRAMPCATCERTRIAVETRRSLGADGRAGQHTFARVRNLNAHAVALVVAFEPDHLADGDGFVPAEYWPLQLAPADSARAETVLMLRRPRPVRAAVHDVERF